MVFTFIGCSSNDVYDSSSKQESTDSGIDFSQFAQYKVALSTVDDKNYGVPFDSGVAINALRIDILDECGYTIDDLTDITWSEYI